MSDEKFNIIIFLSVMGLFTGATIEITEGSIFIGILLFIIALFLTTRLKMNARTIAKGSRFWIVLGISVVAADLIYNLRAWNQLGTLDTMVFFLGLSFAAYGIKNEQTRKMGEFGMYMSATFIAMFLFFYSFLPRINNNFIHYFDHYFVLLPSLTIVRFFTDLPIEVVATETVRIRGVEDSTIVIGGPCSGLYSMFLLVGLIVGYAKMEGLTEKKKLLFLVVLSVIAAYTANLVRVSVLYNVAYHYGTETMMFVHVHLGWMLFIVIAAGLIMVLNKMKH